MMGTSLSVVYVPFRTSCIDTQSVTYARVLAHLYN